MEIQNNSRYLQTILFVCKVVEGVEYHMNWTSPKDTTLLLLSISAFILTYQYALIYIPIFLVGRILYNFTTNAVCDPLETDKS